MHPAIKVFAPHKLVPGLAADSNREVTHQFRQIADAIDGVITAITVPVSELKTASGYVVKMGEVARVNPPAAGLTITLPPVTESNEGDECAICVTSVASGGSVVVGAVDGAKINGATTLTLSAVGIYVFTSLGGSFEGWTTPPVGGGGGLSPPVALTDLQNIGDETFLGNTSGAPAPPSALNLSSLAGTGLTWNSGTNALDASASGGTDPRIFAWFGV